MRERLCLKATLVVMARKGFVPSPNMVKSFSVDMLFECMENDLIFTVPMLSSGEIDTKWVNALIHVSKRPDTH